MEAFVVDQAVEMLIDIVDVFQSVIVEEVEDIKLNLGWKRGQRQWHSDGTTL